MESEEKRNQKASEQQAKVLAEKKESEATVLADLNAMSADELRAELTNKNKDYVFKMRRSLMEGGYTEADADAKIAEFLPEIIQAQRAGKPASQLYGPPTSKVDSMLHAPAKPREIKYWMRATDWSFLYFVILAVVFGAMGLIPGQSKNSAANSGILTLIIMSIAFGFLLTWFTDAMNESREAKKNGTKPSRPLWRTIMLSVAAVFAVMILVSFLAFLNPAINPVLPSYGYILAAAVSYGLRYLFRRYFRIKGRLM